VPSNTNRETQSVDAQNRATLRKIHANSRSILKSCLYSAPMHSTLCLRFLAVGSVLAGAALSTANARAYGFSRTEVSLNLNGASLLSQNNQDYNYNNELSGTGAFYNSTGGYEDTNNDIWVMYSETEAVATPNGIARGLYGHDFLFTIKNETTSALSVEFSVSLERNGEVSVNNLGWEEAWVNLYGGAAKLTTGNYDFRTDSLATNPSLSLTNSFTHSYLASFNLDPNEEATFEIWASTETYARSVVPEPASMATLGLGALALLKRRRK